LVIKSFCRVPLSSAFSMHLIYPMKLFLQGVESSMKSIALRARES